MNICFVTLGHVSKLRGGIDRVTDVLAQALMKKGHKVFMLSVWKPVAGDEIAKYQYFLPSQSIISEENISFVEKFLRESGIDVIVNQSEPMALLELLVSSHGKTPIVSAIHTDPMGTIKGVGDTWDKWRYDYGMLKFILRYPYFLLRKWYQVITRRQYIKKKYFYYYEHCAAVVLLSERYKKPFQRVADIQDTGRLHAIANPFSFVQSEIPERKEKLILFVGRLEFQKRLDRLFEVWSKIKIKNKDGWRLAVLGDGPDRDFYERLAVQMKLSNISFEGLVDPLPYYEKASVLCVMSSHEGFSLAISEGLQHEVIPMAFDSYEAVYDLIDSGNNGYIIPAFSIHRYARCLKRLMMEDDLREQIRLRIREQNAGQSKFDIDVIANKWITLFENIK